MIMPRSLLPEFIQRLGSLEDQMKQHLEESVLVHTRIAKLQENMRWNTWLTMGIAGGIGAIVVALAIVALKSA